LAFSETNWMRHLDWRRAGGSHPATRQARLIRGPEGKALRRGALQIHLPNVSVALGIAALKAHLLAIGGFVPIG
jgi:hypothetical protein